LWVSLLLFEFPGSLSFAAFFQNNNITHALRPVRSHALYDKILNKLITYIF
jgi:hypothetical protein